MPSKPDNGTIYATLAALCFALGMITLLAIFGKALPGEAYSLLAAFPATLAATLAYRKTAASGVKMDAVQASVEVNHAASANTRAQIASIKDSLDANLKQ
jgi:hypothetical protein